ncbi:ArsR/SmtB family transcription factor [Virgibacillus alimentarius]|uniref:DNA-binding transcriptional ArsR family regulator n=1 Tax=Virgibacillus alimentarius TaxID=698769 RepID=A0ABS4S811_9BACI|nr:MULTISPECIES: metalloregulator ArsR/SmtB family transcription factor [Virgibacillus]MBP2257638.1 DNA-binding transcriptional ArsR family regulator [Virgibacillus alimentarius]HLR68473.1 metalloregulator ArsR/SmtB family transcription factor [Virgibacillus sp.]
MSKIDLDTKVKFIHGFSHKTRIQILDSIKDNEKTVSQIVDEIEGNQSSVSQHLACLRGCGLIVSRQEGKFVYYQLRNEKVRQLLAMFDDVLIDIHMDIGTCKNHII